jgi:hypothetical protein
LGLFFLRLFGRRHRASFYVWTGVIVRQHQPVDGGIVDTRASENLQAGSGCDRNGHCSADDLCLPFITRGDGAEAGT